MATGLRDKSIALATFLERVRPVGQQLFPRFRSSLLQSWASFGGMGFFINRPVRFQIMVSSLAFPSSPSTRMGIPVQ